MDEWLERIALEAKGFMPRNEGRALYEAALLGATWGPLLEIGSYCGKSAVYLGAAARRSGSTLYTIDHHRGSEEHQLGEEYHDADVYDARLQRVDSLPCLLATIARAGLAGTIAPIVSDANEIARRWRLPLGLVFIDGGHSDAAAEDDYESWAPHIEMRGLLAIHDVFEDPKKGGRPPFNVFRRALRSAAFVERSRAGSLRVLERVRDGI